MFKHFKFEIKAQLEGLKFKDNIVRHRQVLILSSLLYVTLFAFIVFFFINIYHGLYNIAGVDLVAVFLIIYSLYTIYKNQNVKLVSYIFAALMFLFLIYFTCIHKNESFGLVWTYAYPIFVIPILGLKVGLIVTLMFYSVIMPISYLGIGDWNHGNWDVVSFLRFLISSVYFILNGYLLEASFMRTNDKLTAVRKKEQTYAEELSKTNTKLHQEVQQRKQVAVDRKRLIDDLQSAIKEIKTLRGIVPICSNCKKIRDDKGYWNILESYIQKHSDAQFSHGICPECTKRFYPEYYIAED